MSARTLRRRVQRAREIESAAATDVSSDNATLASTQQATLEDLTGEGSQATLQTDIKPEPLLAGCADLHTIQVRCSTANAKYGVGASGANGRGMRQVAQFARDSSGEPPLLGRRAQPGHVHAARRPRTWRGPRGAVPALHRAQVASHPQERLLVRRVCGHPESKRLKITLTGTDAALCVVGRTRPQEPHAVCPRHRLPDAPAVPTTSAVRHAKHGAGMRAPRCAWLAGRLRRGLTAAALPGTGMGRGGAPCRTRAAFASAARRGCGSRGARTSTSRRPAGSATRTNAGAATPPASRTSRPPSMAS